MRAQTLNQRLSLMLLLVFIGFFAAIRLLSQSPGYSYSQQYYRGAYDYSYSYANRPYGWGPYLMPSTSYNSYYGYRPNYDSYIYIHNALDYTYYTNPQLLEPRYMNNNARLVRGAWPQGFWY